MSTQGPGVNKGQKTSKVTHKYHKKNPETEGGGGRTSAPNKIMQVKRDLSERRTPRKPPARLSTSREVAQKGFTNNRKLSKFAEYSHTP